MREEAPTSLYSRRKPALVNDATRRASNVEYKSGSDILAGRYMRRTKISRDWQPREKRIGERNSGEERARVSVENVTSSLKYNRQRTPCLHTGILQVASTLRRATGRFEAE